MIIKFLKVLILPSFIFFSISCDKEQPSNNKQTEDLAVTFGGLNAKIPKNHSVDELTMSIDDYKQILTNTNSKLKSLKALEYYSIDLLDSLSEIVLMNYPKIDSIEYDKIRQEFIGLSDEDIIKNIDIIDSFYISFITYDLIKKIADFPIETNHKSSSKLKNSMYGGYDDSELNQNEFWVLAKHPRLINGAKQAKERSLTYTEMYFPVATYGQPYRNRADAFRHAILNAFLAKEAGKYKNWSYQCIDFAKDLTNAHESGSSKPDGLSDEEWYLDKQMDLHNNAIGRVYFNDVSHSHKSCWVCNRHVDSPSESDMASAIYGTYIPGSIIVTTKGQMDSYPSSLVYFQ